ncbi:MAG: flavodoxin-dependent (E)-4-hydroxy-3-methylbut-2-enyl-diphosphate synthase [Candidatus Omnitrophica bacterium]|nr:flavodoxin-dependent (E)-4-hydroxy-3-methylbut-2-enyl-diphosphate synthase [Candidatus Omnitrophota bacterium]
MITRKKTKQVFVGDVPIGGGAPVVIQSMTNTLTTDVKGTVRQIRELEEEGCDVVRVAVPDADSVKALPGIIKKIGIPLIADIHFDAKLAIASIEQGAAKIRINPGNMKKSELTELAKIARRRKVPIRIGVNSGSLEKHILKKYGNPTAEALTESAVEMTAVFEDVGFTDMVISVKSEDVLTTIEAYRLLSRQVRYPLHIGVTEAGTLLRGSVASSAACGILLSEGIGDTIRISLTDHPRFEVRTARFLLESLKLRRPGARVFSCPTCARTEIDIIKLANAVETLTAGIDRDITIAVMGCLVNGPGEMRGADFGICGLKGKAALYKAGRFVRNVSPKEAARELLREIRSGV